MNNLKRAKYSPYRIKKIAREYVSNWKITLSDLAQKYNVSLGTLETWCFREKWVKARIYGWKL